MVRRYFLIVLMLLMLHPAMAVWVKTEFDYKGATAAEAVLCSSCAMRIYSK